MLSVDQEFAFAGAVYDDARDRLRLSTQLQRVYDLMQDGRWRFLQEISDETGDPPASVSAQLRHLRKKRFGGFTVEKSYQGDGLFLYRVLAP